MRRHVVVGFDWFWKAMGGKQGRNQKRSLAIVDQIVSFFKSGRSAARLAHLLWEQRVVSSNPTAPTNNALARIGMSARSSTG